MSPLATLFPLASRSSPPSSNMNTGSMRVGEIQCCCLIPAAAVTRSLSASILIGGRGGVMSTRIGYVCPEVAQFG